MLVGKHKSTACTQMVRSSSANGAKCNSLGQRPRIRPSPQVASAEARNIDIPAIRRIRCALSALESAPAGEPRPCWAYYFRAWRLESSSNIKALSSEDLTEIGQTPARLNSGDWRVLSFNRRRILRRYSLRPHKAQRRISRCAGILSGRGPTSALLVVVVILIPKVPIQPLVSLIANRAYGD